jgi:hypothetical protein
MQATDSVAVKLFWTVKQAVFSAITVTACEAERADFAGTLNHGLSHDIARIQVQ